MGGSGWTFGGGLAAPGLADSAAQAITTQPAARQTAKVLIMK
jgi:hypothetical protein